MFSVTNTNIIWQAGLGINEMKLIFVLEKLGLKWESNPWPTRLTSDRTRLAGPGALTNWAIEATDSIIEIHIFIQHSLPSHASNLSS